MSHKKWKEEFPEQYAISKTMYDLNASGTLESKADRAAAKIYRAGIGHRDGRISPGTNNPMADFAAAAFDEGDLHALRATNDLRLTGFAAIISLRQEYNSMIEQEESRGNNDTYWLHTDLLEKIEEKAQWLIKDLGWKPPKAF